MRGIVKGVKVACARLSVVGDERKRARKKRGRTKARRGTESLEQARVKVAT